MEHTLKWVLRSKCRWPLFLHLAFIVFPVAGIHPASFDSDDLEGARKRIRGHSVLALQGMELPEPLPAPEALGGLKAPLQQVKVESSGDSAKGDWGLRSELRNAILELEKAGRLGELGIVLIFSLWICLSLPSTPIEVVGGCIFGAAGGFCVGLLSKTLGSSMGFLAARKLGRYFDLQVPEVLSLKLVSLQRRPVLTMMGIRLAPLPLGLKNYGLGLSEVPFGSYLLATVLVDIPFSALWGFTGAHCHSLAEALSMDGSGGRGPNRSIFWTVTSLTVACCVAWKLRSCWESSCASELEELGGDPCKRPGRGSACFEGRELVSEPFSSLGRWPARPT